MQANRNRQKYASFISLQRIQLTFQRTDLDYCASYSCDCHKITIYDSKSKRLDRRSQQFCEYASERTIVVLPTGHIKVVFEADGKGRGDGLEASWKPLHSNEIDPAESCDQVLMADSGALSVVHPDPSSDLVNCTWTIRSREEVSCLQGRFTTNAALLRTVSRHFARK